MSVTSSTKIEGAKHYETLTKGDFFLSLAVEFDAGRRVAKLSIVDGRSDQIVLDAKLEVETLAEAVDFARGEARKHFETLKGYADRD